MAELCSFIVLFILLFDLSIGLTSINLHILLLDLRRLSVLVVVIAEAALKSNVNVRLAPCSDRRLVAYLMVFPIYDDSQLEQLTL